MKPRQPVFQGAKSDDESKDEEQQRNCSTLSILTVCFFYYIPPHTAPSPTDGRTKKKKENYDYGKASVYFRVRYRRTSR